MDKEKFERIVPLRDQVLAMMEDKPSYGMIEVPDTFKDRSPYMLVHEVGPDAHPALKKGTIGIVSANSEDKKNHFKVGSRKMFFTPSHKVQAIVVKNRFFPLGDRVLIRRRRDLHPDYLAGGELALPQQWSQEQSLFGEVVRFGLPLGNKDPRTNGLKVGELIRLKAWEHSQFELDIKGVYHLIVDIDDILLKETHEQINN